jgi:hypothetical protein
MAIAGRDRQRECATARSSSLRVTPGGRKPPHQLIAETFAGTRRIYDAGPAKSPSEETMFKRSVIAGWCCLGTEWCGAGLRTGLIGSAA